jgi:hypothetical protein
VSDFSEYTAAGWKLCAIERGNKGPRYSQWNTKPIAADALDGLDGAGLLHALSGTCAIDIDDIDAARSWLAERGVDIDALLQDDRAVQIRSGRPNRAKLLYAMRRPLRTFKPKDSGLELRCATADITKSVQDVLPPSIHPITSKPYEWAGGILADWRALPPIPVGLLSIWRAMTPEEAEVESLPEPTVIRPKIDLGKLRKAAFKHSPDSAYDEWLRVGMQLHEGTGGAQEGFNIWCDWSKGIKRAPYPGDATLKSHWLSFTSTPGKNVATGAALAAELPAEAEDFPIEEGSTEATAPEGKALERQQALDKLIGRFVFVTREQEYFDADRNTLIGDKAIRHLLTPYMPRKNGREIDPVDKLMRARNKTSVEALAFHPGEKAIFTHNTRRYANTFYDSMPTPLEPTNDELEKINWLLNRIDDVEYRDWLRQFFAHMVQRPGVKIRSAPLIWSEIQGNGKSTLVGTIPKLIVGEEYYVEVNAGMLNSDFNDYLSSKWHATLAEFRAGTRGERESISKKVENWIADDILSVHPKGGKAYSIPNHLVITASTNKDDAALIDSNDRKWAIHELHALPMTGSEKEWIFTKFLRTARASAVLRHYFAGISLVGFDPNADAPRTQARQNMIASAVSLDYELLLTAFEQRTEPLSHDNVILGDVGDYVRRHCFVKPTNEKLNKMLCKAPFNGAVCQFRIGASHYRTLNMRNHDKWKGVTFEQIMTNISGDDVDITQ